MKTSKASLALAIVLCGAFAAESAFAWGRARVGVGFYFGGPVAAFPYYYPSPYYAPPYYYPHYYPATVVVPAQPTVYVEQGAPPYQSAPVQSAPQQPAGYWYYCADARTYYPYVKNCTSGWQRVAPQPQS